MHATTVAMIGNSAAATHGPRPSMRDPSEGLRLMKAFLATQDANLRAEIVRIVEELAGRSYESKEVVRDSVVYDWDCVRDKGER